MASTDHFANVYLVDARQSTFNEAGRDVHVHNTFNPSNDEREILAMLQPLKREGHARSCMKDTRKRILHEIINWTNDFSAPNTLLLTGSPGAGKSTIAASIIDTLDSQKRLGSSIAFKHSDTNLSNPAAIWPTVASDLTRFHPDIKLTIVDVLKGVDPSTSNIASQFRRWIEHPLLNNEKVLSQSPPVIVLDALDECGFDSARRDQRKALIDTLMSWQSLSPQFKMIVTSRNEGLPPNFVRACKLIELHTGDHVDLEAENDIKQFLKRSFSEISSRYESLGSWPEEQIVERLAREAAGLFIWVDTLIHFIDNEESSPDIQLDLILGGEYGDEGDTMSRLYSHILDIKFGKATRKILEAFHAIIGTIVLAKVPLQCKSLIHFLNKEITEQDINFVLHKLSSVLSIGEEDKKIHFCHLSFRDFLCDPNRSQIYAIDLPVQRMKLTEMCFKVMGDHLRFNICDLPTSHLKNSEVDDLQDRIEKYIPDELVYACCFGIQHAMDTQQNDSKQLQEHKSIKEIYNFLGQQLLCWLEVMSLIGEVKTAQVTLLSMVGSMSDIENKDLAVLAGDAAKFAVQFGNAIQTSAPHVYVSALPWSPRNSSIAQYYMCNFPHILSFAKDQEIIWTALRTVMHGHSSIVTSVSFSPDGELVASGSDDKTICIWDTETGKVAASPFEGHSRPVNSVSFSPDGKLVASSSDDKTICIWDTETGKMAAGPFEGHSQGVTSVSFSPDGKLVASGSMDNTVCIWDAKTGKVAAGPFEGHSNYVTSVSFSPDGKLVASGSWDYTICIWDVETGKVAASPFECDSQGVTSVSFSPDGKLVASGSYDNTICIWDAETGKVAAGPFEGHSHVTSVSFSPDGRLVASGSRDNTICIWDAETGKAATGPFEGHSSWVTSVSFSPDGKLVASGSMDNTIYIWDAETGKVVAGPFDGHSQGVTSVSFSPDGKLIASGSYDNTICLWEVETSRVSFGSHCDAAIDSSQSCEPSAPEFCDTRAAHNSKEFYCCHYGASSGWMKSPDGKGLLFWVPPQYQGRVCGTDLHAMLGGLS